MPRKRPTTWFDKLLIKADRVCGKKGRAVQRLGWKVEPHVERSLKTIKANPKTSAAIAGAVVLAAFVLFKRRH